MVKPLVETPSPGATERAHQVHSTTRWDNAGTRGLRCVTYGVWPVSVAGFPASSYLLCSGCEVLLVPVYRCL